MKRTEGESFEDYKQRRAIFQKTKPNIRVLWSNKNENGKGVTYVKAIYGDLL